MSGGSLNYLYCKDPDELYNCINEMEKAEEFLLKEGYSDVAKDVRRLIEYVIISRNRIEVLQENLKKVFRSIEWYDSGDSGKEAVIKAVEDYRNKQKRRMM